MAKQNLYIHLFYTVTQNMRFQKIVEILKKGFFIIKVLYILNCKLNLDFLINLHKKAQSCLETEFIIFSNHKFSKNICFSGFIIKKA